MACDVGSIGGTLVHLQVCYCYIFGSGREEGREREEENGRQGGWEGEGERERGRKRMGWRRKVEREKEREKEEYERVEGNGEGRKKRIGGRGRGVEWKGLTAKVHVICRLILLFTVISKEFCTRGELIGHLATQGNEPKANKQEENGVAILHNYCSSCAMCYEYDHIAYQSTCFTHNPNSSVCKEVGKHTRLN